MIVSYTTSGDRDHTSSSQYLRDGVVHRVAEAEDDGGDENSSTLHC